MKSLFTREERVERDARMAAAVTSYGVGTHSYNASAERRESKRQQAEATARYLAQPRTVMLLDGSWLICRCDGQVEPHPAHAMREILNYTPWFRWDHWRQNGTSGKSGDVCG